MRRDLLIAAGPGEWRAALLEDGVAVEMFVERGDRCEPGSLHLGRVVRRVPALGAVLVDIGDERPAFLPFGEALGAARLDEGARALVQIRREGQGGKAARATMRVLVRGAHVELRIGRPGLVGGDALPEEDRATLVASAPLIPSLASGGGPGWGLRILEPAPVDILASEVAALAERWAEITARAESLQPPARLDPPATRATGFVAAAPDRIRCDDHAAIPEIRAAFPAAEVAYQAESDWPIGLDALFDVALSPTVAIGDGAVHFEPTRAGVLVDVDTGTAESGSPQRNALAANLAAAAVIARQIRLRRLGGGIIVDFIGLDRGDWRAQVRAALAAALQPDPARPQILGWTRLGHLELVRPRCGRPLAESLLVPAPGGVLVKTPATLAHEALRALWREARAQPARNWRVRAAPSVAAALEGAAAGAVRGLAARLGRPIAIAAEPSIERFQIEPA
jgi:ribonuclease G